MQSCLFKTVVKFPLREEGHLLLLMRHTFEIRFHPFGGKFFVGIVGLLINTERIFHLLDILIHSGV